METIKKNEINTPVLVEIEEVIYIHEINSQHEPK